MAMQWDGARAGAVALAISMAAGVATAQAPPPTPAPLEVYGGMPAYDLVEVSPSGDRLAYIAVVGEDRNLIINDLSDMSLIGGVRAGDVKVRGLDWIGEDHVVISTSATQSSAAMGLSRSELWEGQIYSVPSRQVAKVLARTPDVFPRLAGALQVRDGVLYSPGSSRKGIGLYRIDLATGRGQVIEDPAGAGGYLINGAGQPIARTAWDGRTGEYELQAKRGGFWRTVWRMTALIDPPSLLSLGPNDRTVIIDGTPNDRPDGLHLFDLDSGAWSDLPFEGRPTSVVTHPSTRLLVGARTETETGTEFQFLDPVADRSWRAVKAAFSGKQSQLVSWSTDLRQIVVFTQGSGDAGPYQLVDLDRRSAEIVGEAYPGLTGAQVGEVRPIAYTAADGLRIPGYLTLPPGVTEPKGLPLVVLAHGGPASRDVLQFDWWAQAIASRGYAVLQPNFRGSDGLGKAHLEAGYGEWGRKMQTDLSDGVRWLAAEGIIDPARVCIVGASYGGYAAMAGPTLDAGVYRCAVSVAGVSDLRRMVQWTAEEANSRNNPTVRYWNRFMGAERLGDRALDDISPARQAARADAPILLLHGADDTVVPFEQSRLMAEALERVGKPHELVRLGGEDHWLSRADTRRRMLVETVRFLESNNPVRMD